MVFPYRKSQVPDSYITVNSAKMSFPASDSRPPITKALVTSCGGGDGGDGSAEAVDDQSRKIRKPYTFTKSRESWTDLEHDKFLEALHLFDRDWKKIEAFVGSKTAIQIRSHAQKYFLKVQKNGTNEHVPPPRPKRKAAHPYPHKAPKIAVTKVREPFQSSADFLQPAFIIAQDSVDLRNQAGTADLSTWTGSAMQPPGVPYCMQDDMRLSGTFMPCSCCSSSIESNAGVCPSGETKNHGNTGRVMPDFAQVYRFIGDVFDPKASNHLQKLKTMDPVDVETALLLMKNLCANLTSPKFEDHRRLLSSYNVVTERTSHSSSFSNLHAVTSRNAIPSS